MTVRFIIAALAATALSSGAGYAQDEPQIGSRLVKRKDVAIPHSQREAAQAAQRLAGCIYLKQGSAVRAALDTRDPAEAVKRIGQLDNRGTCLNLSMVADGSVAQRASMPVDLYRGALAEAVLRKDRMGATLAPNERKPSYAADWFAATTRPLAVDEMALCIAETNPAAIRALIVTPAQSDEEKRAFSGVAPLLGPCLTVGANLNANKQAIRAALAEALYQRAVAPAAPQAAQQ
jgi:hypothetical protein